MPQPTVEDILAQLEAEEQGEETGTNDAGNQPRESSVIKQLRTAVKARDKAAKAAEERAAVAEEALQARVQAETSRILSGAGLSPRQAEVFLKAYGEATPENLTEFRKDVLGVTTPAPQGEASAEEFAPTGPVSGGGEGEKPLSKSEFEALWRRDPVEADRRAAAGEVDFYRP